MRASLLLQVAPIVGLVVNLALVVVVIILHRWRSCITSALLITAFLLFALENGLRALELRSLVVPFTSFLGPAASICILAAVVSEITYRHLHRPAADELHR